MNQPRQKKIPQRQCIGCGESRPKKELIRVVRSPEGELSIDFTGKKPGRGAYVCPSDKCLKRAVKSKKLARSLECEIPDEIYTALAEEIAFAEKMERDNEK